MSGFKNCSKPKWTNCWAAVSPSGERSCIARPVTAAGVVPAADAEWWDSHGLKTLRAGPAAAFRQSSAAVRAADTEGKTKLLPKLYLHGPALGDFDLALGLVGRGGAALNHDRTGVASLVQLTMAHPPSKDGRVLQRTELTLEQANLLKSLDIPPQPRVYTVSVRS